MFQVKPNFEIPLTECPKCGNAQTPSDFIIPGMRSLAEYRCSSCAAEFYGDLPTGQGLYTPVLLDKQSGNVHGDGWFADWLEEGFRNRKCESLSIDFRQFRPLGTSVVLLNCLDTLYGHSLLKLLNAQYYIDNRPDLSLIVMVPNALEWMLPDGIAEAWIIDLPFGRGTSWNDWLACEIRRRLHEIDTIYLSPAFSHPHADDFDIERFTRVRPLDLDGPGIDTPVVTFIWRDDRNWNPAANQVDGVVKLAESLRRASPDIDFSVAGMGLAGGLPDWIGDLRTTRFDPAIERSLCERYARSHIVIGVHGSNMLLPTGHAGAAISLMPRDRWGNYLQDILVRTSDARDVMFRYRVLPDTTEPGEIAEIAATMLRRPEFTRLMGREYTRHGEAQMHDRWRS